MPPNPGEAVPELNPTLFRRRLMTWYRLHARTLPWRGTSNPYRIWVSEIMLQQTRVAAVIDHYNEFLRRFPTLVSLALAPEADVLAAWSGLGYYRRARMLHKAAQFIMMERDGRLPTTSAELRTLPGIGEYTAAAIASIAFGESIAVLDGNVERVLLRLTGQASEANAETPSGAQARAILRAQAQALVPSKYLRTAESHFKSQRESQIESQPDPAGNPLVTNAAGDHNQAMMELGATICLPRAPLCLQCPVHALCRTRGEHATPPRAPQLSRPVAYLLDLRKRGTATEVLLERRSADASLMPGMYELPPLPLDAVEGREPVLRVRHSITQTNYYVQVFAPRPLDSRHSIDSSDSSRPAPAIPTNRTRAAAAALRRAVPAAPSDLEWTRTSRLNNLPLTGLTRKILRRLKVMQNPRLTLGE